MSASSPASATPASAPAPVLSEPPPSYPGGTPAEGLPAVPRATSPSLHGWRPADDDDGGAAVAWRARTALRRADRGLASNAALKGSVDGLNTTIMNWSVTWGKRWERAAFWLKVAMVPVVGAAAVAAFWWIWRWVSTLHH